MKKLFMLLLICCSLVGCSTEDSIPESVQDPIIGTWKIVEMTEYPSNSNPIVTTYDECYQRSRITFKADGNYESKSYQLNSDGSCEELVFEGQTTVSSTWQKISANKYRFTEEIINDGNTMFNTSTPESITFPFSNTMEMLYMWLFRFELCQ
ncbi:lipocalin family protein [Antarcticibacterium flavum]|uniref:Lipocalin family protein n=1 Tax=Antarcticibacterium flavum TaxID=2058175 RepID=A0A5B7X816_9FLAO|nr:MULTISPECIES: lipocalin family protein [Antarcticibacterium]MCM4159528.1 hypothetical protein [Antarcticibacterium sp. W02-3]QCY70781.1 lipocalin family protein [Antarcticibacterium flavum]